MGTSLGPNLTPRVPIYDVMWNILIPPAKGFLDPFQMTGNPIVIDVSPISMAGKEGSYFTSFNILQYFDVLYARIVLNPCRKGQQLRES